MPLASRQSDGPSPGEKYYLRDLLLLVNLTDSPLPGPMLGVGESLSGFDRALLEQGFARNPQFGGAGPVELTELPAGGVYATLVPNEVSNLEVTANFSNIPFQQGVLFNSLDVHYITDSSSIAADFNEDGFVNGADLRRWGDGFGAAIGAVHANFDANFRRRRLPRVAAAVRPTGFG